MRWPLYTLTRNFKCDAKTSYTIVRGGMRLYGIQPYLGLVARAVTGRVPHPGVRKSGNRCRYCPRRRSCTSRDTAVRPLRAGPAQNASCCSAAAFSANPMSNRQRAEEQQDSAAELNSSSFRGESLLDAAIHRSSNRCCCAAPIEEHGGGGRGERVRLWHTVAVSGLAHG